jgi:primary-amine oxidase
MHGTSQDQRGRHPLAPLSEDEVRDTAAIVRAYPEYADGSVFVYIWLREPAKSALTEYEVTGRRPARESKVVLYDRSLRLVTEVVVSLTDGKVRSWQPVPGARPKASRRDFQGAVEAAGDALPRGYRLHPC